MPAKEMQVGYFWMKSSLTKMSSSTKTFTSVLWALNAILIALFLIPIGELPTLARFFGRLHPLILHFPVALILIALLFEIISKTRGRTEFSTPAALLLWLGAFSAVLSAIAGYLLSLEGGYSGNSFDFHQWFGLATSIIATSLIHFKTRVRFKQFFLPVYSLLAILLIVTGHFGASLTHGENFLTEVFVEDAPIVLEPNSVVFSQVVQPLLDTKCASCHNPNKLKGELSLASAEGLSKGGENGPVFIAGNVLNSTLISHLLLPTEEKLHMPPKGKPQLTNEEIKLLTWWVESGASFTQLVQDISPEDPVQNILASYFAPEEEIDIDFVPQEEIAQLNTKNISVKQMEEDKPYLEVYIGQQVSLSLDELKPLRKIRHQIYSLDLGGSYVDKSILKEVARFDNLHRLYLDNTPANDNMLSAIRKLKNLEYLNLYGTKVTRKGAIQMLKLKGLEKLYLWQTRVDEEDLIEFQKNFSNIEINGGLGQDSEFTKAQLVMPKLEFESTFFNEEMSVQIPYNLADTKIYYQLGEEDAQLFEADELLLTTSTKLTVFAKKEGWEDSPIAEQVFIKIQTNALKSTTLKHEPKGSYKAKGIKTLFDLTKGSENFRDGNWLGFNGDDLVADVALSESQALETVYISTMDDTGSWIFPPTELEVWGGPSADQLTKLQSLSITPPDGPEPKHMKIHQLAFQIQDLKYLRIVAKNYGNLPAWHPGKDTPAWLFIDEIAFQ